MKEDLKGQCCRGGWRWKWGEKSGRSNCKHNQETARRESVVKRVRKEASPCEQVDAGSNASRISLAKRLDEVGSKHGEKGKCTGEEERKGLACRWRRRGNFSGGKVEKSEIPAAREIGTSERKWKAAGRGREREEGGGRNECCEGREEVEG
jgi:hypothetical protein